MVSASLASESSTAIHDSTASLTHRWLLWALYLLSFALIIWLFMDGYSYYLTPYAQRPHNPDYRILRPAGSRGLVYGITGSAMMLLMLVYTVRKRTRWLGRSLPLSRLLDFHIYMGVIGPLLIVLHTSFKVQGLVAVSFWSMVAVALSGYFGRYLYLQIPRNIVGTELSLQEMERTSSEMATAVKDKFALDPAVYARAEALFERESALLEHGAFAAVTSLLIDDLMRPFAKRRLRRQLATIILLPHRQFRELFDISFRRMLLRRRIRVMSQVQMLFHHWHVIHKPFAIVMYIIMAIHIGVALWTGYGWIR